MSNVLLFLITFTVFTSSVFGMGDETLLQLAKEGFEARTGASNLTNKESTVQPFRKPFQGLEDSQKIKALALYLYDIDQTNAKWSMSAAITMSTALVLSDDPDLINDWSSLREMLKNEIDPRKFYLLSSLVPLAKQEPQHDFIAERTHMLFKDGRVAKDEGEYTRDYADDVSEYSYTAIIGNLRVLGADFEPPAKDLPHEEQVLILAKLLKERWPGCENLEIPEKLAPQKMRPDKKNQGFETSLHPDAKASKETFAKAKADQAAEKSQWPWLIGGIFLSIFFF
jgi:hypothetical protein